MSVRSTATSTTFSARRNIRGDTRTLPPATRIPHGESVVLHWEGLPGRHTLFTDWAPDGEPVTSPHITEALTRDTVFTLRTVTGELARYHTVTVTVDTPALPGLKTDAFRGDLSLSVPGTLTVSGDAFVSGTATVNGDCTADTIRATGRVETGTVTVTGEVTSSDANARLETEELRVVEGVETTRGLSVSDGPVDLFGTPLVHAGNNAPADGFAVAVHQGEAMELTTSSGGTSTTIQVKGTGRYQWAAGALPVHVGDRMEITPAGTRVLLVPLGHAATVAAPDSRDAAIPENDHT